MLVELLGGLWLASFLYVIWQFHKAPLLPPGHPEFEDWDRA